MTPCTYIVIVTLRVRLGLDQQMLGLWCQEKRPQVRTTPSYTTYTEPRFTPIVAADSQLQHHGMGRAFRNVTEAAKR